MLHPNRMAIGYRSYYHSISFTIGFSKYHAIAKANIASAPESFCENTDIIPYIQETSPKIKRNNKWTKSSVSTALVSFFFLRLVILKFFNPTLDNSLSSIEGFDDAVGEHRIFCVNALFPHSLSELECTRTPKII